MISCIVCGTLLLILGVGVTVYHFIWKNKHKEHVLFNVFCMIVIAFIWFISIQMGQNTHVKDKNRIQQQLEKEVTKEHIEDAITWNREELLGNNLWSSFSIREVVLFDIEALEAKLPAETTTVTTSEASTISAEE